MQHKQSQAAGIIHTLPSRTKIGIVVSNYYPEITEGLLDAARQEILSWGVSSKSIRIVRVSGSFEIPFGCLQLLTQGQVDGVVTLGCLIKGETAHDEYIASAVSQAIMQLMLQYKKPVSFGVITALNPKQAKNRSQGSGNKGKEAAVAVLWGLATNHALRAS